ncbi:MAG: hypothetical protein EAX86_06535 [Candidatus Heimdallarchaeota archaeon]|nr:hypothetical protein [Candidatus Heimdallarchaeota archaeon]
MKILVAFDSKYGNTKTVAETIVDGMEAIGDINVTLINMKKVDFKKLDEYDAIVMGCPTHFGKATRTAMKFIERLGKTSETGKPIATFDTYFKTDFEKAVKKMEKKIREEISGSQLLLPSLSIEVEDMKGPILEKELPKCREFGKRIVSQLKSEF